MGSRKKAGRARKRDGGTSRRKFLGTVGSAAAAAALGAGVAKTGRAAAQSSPTKPQDPPVSPKPKPKPKIDTKTIAEAEKLARVEFTEAEREQIVSTVERSLNFYPQLRSAKLDNGEGPAEVFDPRLPDTVLPARARKARFAGGNPGPLPEDDENIAFAPVSSLSVWLRKRLITSERLTKIYLTRLEKYGPKLEAIVTLTKDLALKQARRADRELRAGKVRGPLHGVPWGAKDLLDTAGIKTTWGAEPYKNRVPESDAAVVKKLEEAGAVLVAKLTLGALAYGDIWFGGKTRNPFKPEQGSSGSSAGSAACVTAGLCGFTIGTETYGSIGSPSARCGASGFRPTFGRVSRAGAMALCWSLDKIGPICRTVHDCAIVLDAIHGRDDADESTLDVPLNIDMKAPLSELRVGYVPAQFESRRASQADARTLETLKSLGVKMVEVEAPSGRFGDTISIVINVEAAAAFDELTRKNLDDKLKWQEAWAWPNTFRRARLIPAVEYYQARRLRRRFMTQAATLFENIDVFVTPARASGGMTALTNLTGHPSVTIRQQFRRDGTPGAVSLWGGLYRDAALLRVGAALEEQLGLWSKRPKVGVEKREQSF